MGLDKGLVGQLIPRIRGRGLEVVTEPDAVAHLMHHRLHDVRLDERQSGRHIQPPTSATAALTAVVEPQSRSSHGSLRLHVARMVACVAPPRVVSGARAHQPAISVAISVTISTAVCGVAISEGLLDGGARIGESLLPADARREVRGTFGGVRSRRGCRRSGRLGQCDTLCVLAEPVAYPRMREHDVRHEDLPIARVHCVRAHRVDLRVGRDHGMLCVCMCMCMCMGMGMCVCMETCACTRTLHASMHRFVAIHALCIADHALRLKYRWDGTRRQKALPRAQVLAHAVEKASD